MFAYLEAIESHKTFLTNPAEGDFEAAKNAYAKALGILRSELGSGVEEFDGSSVSLNIFVQFLITVILFTFSLFLFSRLAKDPGVQKGSYSSKMIFVLFVAFYVTYASSSFVEEEQQYWYFFVTTAVGLIFFDFKKHIRG